MKPQQKTLYLSPEQQVSTIPPPTSPSDWRVGDQQVLSKSRSYSAKSQGTAHSSTQGFSLETYLKQMAQLIANITESYTAAIFIADETDRVLRPAGIHTLSRDFVSSIEIGFGSGLVGWTAENRARISVCPFERDATTLLYYSCDQHLKSFIAIPVMDESKQKLLGVIACDSKKSYAYAKVTEKILGDCAAQTAAVIELFDRIGSTMKDSEDEYHKKLLAKVIDKLRNHSDEEALLSAAAEIPLELVERDALVVVTTSEGGVGAGKFFPPSAQSGVEHRLWEMVCRHKKVSNGKKSVHALPVDDIKQRSFLSIPVRVLDKEVGSLNLLSKPHHAFTPTAVTALEHIAKITGDELERIRLREGAPSGSNSVGLLPWKLFALRAKSRINSARKNREQLDLLRISVGDVYPRLEDELGISFVAGVSNRVSRMVDQVVRAPAVSGILNNNEFLILVDSRESRALTGRLERLLARLSVTDFASNSVRAKLDLGSILRDNLRIVTASYPDNGETIESLVSRCRSLQKDAHIEQPYSIGEIANAGNW